MNAKIKRFLLWCMILGCGMGLVGCPPTPYCVIPVDRRASSLVIRFAEGRKCNRLPDPIRRVDFYRGLSSKYSESLWNISTEYPGKEIRELKYGVLPEGFSEWTEAKPLMPGETVYIESETSVNQGWSEVVIQN